MTGSELSHAARKAWLYIEQLQDMRDNAQHITSLEGIAHFIKMFNRKADEIRELLSADKDILETLDFLEPVSPDTSGSDYASDIILGKRGQFMVNSGLLIKALESFVRLYLGEEDRERMGVPRQSARS